MSARLKQCRRLLQVRSVQHDLASLEAEQALGHLTALEASAARLDRVRGSFGAEQGMSSGATLARAGEIAMRLDVAKSDLKRSVAGARDHAAASGEARLEARRKQESMSKLSDKAEAEDRKREQSRQQRAPFRRRSAQAEESR